MGRSNPAARAAAGSACSGLRSPLSRYHSACWGAVAQARTASAGRSGVSRRSGGPDSPPKPPSPRAQMLVVVVHSGSPSAPVAVDSRTTSAALSLSHSSATRERRVAVPDAGSGRWTWSPWPAWSSARRSMSMPGRWKPGAARSPEEIPELYHHREGGQYGEGFLVGQVRFGAGGGVGARAEAQVVEEYVAAGPADLADRGVRGERLVVVDGHVSLSRWARGRGAGRGGAHR